MGTTIKPQDTMLVRHLTHCRALTRMATLFAASVWLLLFVSGTVDSGVVDVGGNCNDGDTCTNSADNLVGLACDWLKSTPICAIKVGQTCDPNADKCVTGATCNSGTNKCACTSAYQETAAEVCFNSAHKNLDDECDSGTTCTNKADFSVALACDWLAPTKKCMIKAGQSCTGNTDACVTGATCDGNNVCACGGGYVEVTATKLCFKSAHKDFDEVCDGGAVCTNKADFTVALSCDWLASPKKCMIKVGQPCTGTTGVCVTGATCDGSVCACGGNFEVTDTKLCFNKAHKDLGDACTSEDTCTNKANFLLGLVCDTQADAKVCALKTEESCTGLVDNCVTGAFCSTDNTCTCCGGFKKDSSTNTCTLRDGYIDGACAAVEDCGKNTKCDGSKCTCEENYEAEKGDRNCKEESSGAVSVMISSLTLLLSVVIALRCCQ